MKYTIEVYKKDGRVRKPKGKAQKGERLDRKIDIEADDLDAAYKVAHRDYPEAKGFRTAVFETMVERINLMSRKKYMERYDTPICCSPASETYWSM